MSQTLLHQSIRTDRHSGREITTSTVQQSFTYERTSIGEFIYTTSPTAGENRVSKFAVSTARGYMLKVIKFVTNMGTKVRAFRASES
ncbi:uncharacterized protein LY89DRAFT_730813 [Mollisia scopiformis]|uniref:Uncharacterized protein n=1 Tax=Mollisia scopiformis TaxID=149040 RepID=A0A194XKU2_MOLSC|nr:uncharacterized protein LY89DRAFT_730813 [Mollisia scopiformis]KUJ20798.1 hypothetical protein LY89DRAFT_730813 [Mollisia scopiformis]